MSDTTNDLRNALPDLTLEQIEVYSLLKKGKSEKHPLAEWYLGAIYVLKNDRNPDRFAQAAHSLRELLDNLPRVFVEKGLDQIARSSYFRGLREKLHSQLHEDKKRYPEGWKDKIIDCRLDQTICGIDDYLNQSKLNQNKTPKRKEKFILMCRALNKKTRKEKSEQLHKVWKSFEKWAHHSKDNEEPFKEQLDLFEHLIIGLLTPTTAEDQDAIQEIVAKPKPSQDDIEKLIGLIKRRDANYVYFFKKVDNPIWIHSLKKNGIFATPPSPKPEGDHLLIPPWMPILYLKKVSAQEPKRVVEIILGIKKRDNPLILQEIFTIACDLPDIKLSLRLKPLIKDFLKLPHHYRQGGEDHLFTKILQKWGASPGSARKAAYEMMNDVVSFQADPQMKEKQSLRKNIRGASDISDSESAEKVFSTPLPLELGLGLGLEPAPRFDPWSYQHILEKGVRPLVEHDPYQGACDLIKAVENMNDLKTHSENLSEKSSEDYSYLWCPMLDNAAHDDGDVKEILAQTLTYACKQVYEKAPESISDLDQKLRSSHWKVFRRLRQLLYASYPNDQTLPWIQEELMEHTDYSKWLHHYEFQLMARKASEHFGSRLLNEKDRTTIFKAILRGPSEEEFRQWSGKEFSDEAFQKCQRGFHYRQLRPFATLLSGEELHYFNTLEAEASTEKAITDDSDYLPYDGNSGKGGYVISHSPKSIEEFGNFTDEQLLAYINDWDKEGFEKHNELIQHDISKLAEIFQSFFKNKIVPDIDRLNFWMGKRRDEIARPIYIAAMLGAMCKLVKESDFKNMEQWFQFCGWVLSHPDSAEEKGQPEPSDKSRDYPSWRSSRRAVVDFIAACVDKDVNTPIAERNSLAKLLEQVCVQSDWRLDHNQPILLDYYDPIVEAINNTRSLALETLVKFGMWIHRHMLEDKVPEVPGILSKRMAGDAQFPLTRPENALLGLHFGNICDLNPDWAIGHREIIFSLKDATFRRDAFNSYILYNNEDKQMFEVLHAEFEHAIESLDIEKAAENNGRNFLSKLGHWVFAGYLWELYPLTGNESLLERFYAKTQEAPRYWTRLIFHEIGLKLKNSGKSLDETLRDRVIAFFDWRLAAAESLELQEFTSWLQAECLEPRWRLQCFSEILKLVQKKDVDQLPQITILADFLPDHLALVIECFLRITTAKALKKRVFIKTKEVMSILQLGLDSNETKIRENAQEAKENLLQASIFNHEDFPEND